MHALHFVAILFSAFWGGNISLSLHKYASQKNANTFEGVDQTFPPSKLNLSDLSLPEASLWEM